MHVKLTAQGGQVGGEPFQGVGQAVHAAGGRPERNNLPLHPSEDVCNLFSRHVQCHICCEDRCQGVQSFLQLCRDDGCRELPWRCPGPGAARFRDPVGPEKPPVRPVVIPGHEIPAASRCNKPVGIDMAGSFGRG
jgi:hypothetical protein